MNYLKFTSYIYLVAAAFFIYDGTASYMESETSDAPNNYWLSFLLAGLAIFMFFFRKRFAKKFENPNRKP